MVFGEGLNIVPQVLTLREAAEYARVSKSHLSNVLKGKVPDLPRLRSFRVGRRVVIKRDWLDEWRESAGPEAVR